MIVVCFGISSAKFVFLQFEFHHISARNRKSQEKIYQAQNEQVYLFKPIVTEKNIKKNFLYIT